MKLQDLSPDDSGEEDANETLRDFDQDASEEQRPQDPYADAEWHDDFAPVGSPTEPLHHARPAQAATEAPWQSWA